MRYSATTPNERQRMLDTIGVSSVADLFQSVPEAARTRSAASVLGPLPEGTLLAELEAGKVAPPRVALIGGGLYRHFIPATVDSLCARSEWVTSYTPYQPEVSQGTLRMYYEFQTYVSMLTGQELSNGGMYDGSTACVEAVLMAKRLRPKTNRVLVSAALNPQYLEVLRTYMRFQNVEVVLLPFDRSTGHTLINVDAQTQADAIAVLLQSPNTYGVIEDTAGIAPGAFRIVVVTEAQSLALLKPPPAEVVCGELQSLGIPVQLGGPTAGFFATRREFVRSMPGRLVGRTVDRHGTEAFCITLATREQFIRREKATSNICTSSGLMCLRSVVYTSLLGRKGLQEVARQSARAARAFLAALEEIGLKRAFSGNFFNEFVVDCSARPELARRLEAAGFLLGLPLEAHGLPHHRLVALTEIEYPKMAALIKEVKTHAHAS
ncbi:MAG: aminomethyl-transferring glycine dehydrogenase subunit GcvPA [Planctomycetes bacterium]|nr:aminomethyl-transferring glycine dehydrogenase subunit GcvPA [Planctomycetota bacterium]